MHSLSTGCIQVEMEKPMIEKIGANFKVYKCDLLINGQVVVEVKNVQTLTDHHVNQLKRYMRLLPTNHGVLLNFPTQATAPQVNYYKSYTQQHMEQVTSTFS